MRAKINKIKINKEKINKKNTRSARERKNHFFRDILNDRLKDSFKGVDLDYVFTFGKHKNKTCRHVCMCDAEYIRWCMQNKVLDFRKEVIDYMIQYARAARKKEEERKQAEEKRRQEEEKNDRRQRENAERMRQEEFLKRFWGRGKFWDQEDGWHQTDEAFKNGPHHFHSSDYAKGGYVGGNQSVSVKIASPADQWDHLPDKQKYGKVLGIQGGTKITKSEIRKLWRERLLEYHPDKCERMGEEIKKLGNAMTIKINEAYDYFKRAYGI